MASPYEAPEGAEDLTPEEYAKSQMEGLGIVPIKDLGGLEGITFKDAAKTVAEFTPIIGDAMAAKEVYDELMKDEPNYGLIAALGGAALIGAVPGIGDAAAAGIRKAADALKRLEVDPDAVGSLGGNIRLKPKIVEEDYLTLDNPNYKELRGQVDETTDINAAEALLDSTEEDIAKIREAQAANRKQDEAGKRPFAEEAQALEKNEITSKEFREKAFADVEKFTELEELPTFTEIVFALDKNKREKGIIGLAKSMAQGAKKIAAGDKVMARLDIPAYNRFDVYVPQITFRKEGAKGAESVFSRTMVIEDVKFPTPQKPSFDIARGEKTKYPHATINGQVASNPASKKMYTDQEAHDLAKSVFDDPDFVHVGYNPDRGGFFYDRETNMPVFDSPLVVQIGKQIFAKRSGETSAERVAKMREMDLRKTSPDIKKPTLFSEGGMALEEQMAMNFGDVPDNTIGVDPVSGNEIPLGATAENVRDDIPANLSEGEIVVPTDVVNYHGVKLFEDLRAEAKMGYAQMAQDGRIGGEPMDDAAEDRMMDIELSELDLEVMDDEQDETPVEMARGGMNVERGRGSIYKSYSAPKKAKSTRDRSMSAVVSRAQANKNKPKNRFEAIKNRIRDIVSDDDRRVTLDKKPPTSDPIRPSIAQQINFGGDYKDKEPPKPEPKKRRSSVQGAGDVAQAYKGETEPFSVRYYDQPFYQRLLTNLRKDLGFDEGGMATDEQPHLIGGEDQFNQPFYDPNQMGGFDMENAYVDYGDGTGPVLEMREYMNDAGHRIFITFIDGVPQMEIPAGYYPVEGEGTVVAPEVPPVGGSGGSDSGGSGGSGGMDMPAPTPINYKELTMEELAEMVEDQKKMKGDVIAGGISTLSPFIGGAMKVAMWNTTRQTKKEIQRRRDDPYTSEVDKRRYDKLLEIANAEEPGLIATLLGKITGNDPYAPEVRTPEQTDALYSQLDKMTKAYTPSDQEASSMKTPGVDDSIDWKAEGAKASKAAADKAFKNNPVYKQKKQDEFIQAVKDDPVSFLPPTPTPSGGQDNNPNRPEPSRPSSPSREEQMMVQGIHKGALVDKPKVKKVVKGLKKASKSHAKQADQLEKAMKKKSK